jgi:hypothetical protein
MRLTSERLALGSSVSPASQPELTALLRASTALRASLEQVGSLPHVDPDAEAIEAWLGAAPRRASVPSQPDR